jgi:hypothetical protein
MMDDWLVYAHGKEHQPCLYTKAIALLYVYLPIYITRLLCCKIFYIPPQDVHPETSSSLDAISCFVSILLVAFSLLRFSTLLLAALFLLLLQGDSPLCQRLAR